MKLCSNASRMLICILTLLVFSPVIAEESDPGGAFEHYQHYISRNSTGVYEWRGFVFVNLRIPRNSGCANSRLARVEGLIKVNELLRKWAIDQTADKRIAASGDIPRGVAFVNDLVAKYDPFWAFRDWKLGVECREVPFKEETREFVLGFIYEKDKLIRSIPASFLQPIPVMDGCAALPKIVANSLRNDIRNDFVVECGAYDLLGIYGIALPEKGKGVDEYLTVEKKIKEFLSNSLQIQDYKARMQNIRGPHLSTEYKTKLSSKNTGSDLSVVQVTNLYEKVTVQVATNICNQTAEQKRVGLSCGGKMTDVVSSSDIGVIKATVTRTTVETYEYVLCRTDHTFLGHPVFEEMFVNPQKRACEAKPSTEQGRSAVQLFLAESSLEEKEKAIQEALIENPSDADLWNLFGRCFQQKHDEIAAIICFRNALRLNERHEYAWTNLAETYEQLGCRRMAWGAAVMARAYAKNQWALKHSESVLTR